MIKIKLKKKNSCPTFICPNALVLIWKCHLKQIIIKNNVKLREMIIHLAPLQEILIQFRNYINIHQSCSIYLLLTCFGPKCTQSVQTILLQFILKIGISYFGVFHLYKKRNQYSKHSTSAKQDATLICQFEILIFQFIFWFQLTI